MKSILDPTFRYTPSIQTDIRKTFARIRREQRIGCSSEDLAHPLQRPQATVGGRAATRGRTQA
jgi:hypothetical protein